MFTHIRYITYRITPYTLLLHSDVYAQYCGVYNDVYAYSNKMHHIVLSFDSERTLTFIHIILACMTQHKEHKENLHMRLFIIAPHDRWRIRNLRILETTYIVDVMIMKET